MFRKKEIIQAIYREGGFSKASKVLHIAQPSLSVMVSGIEKEIGARLFDRSTSPVRLTEIGEKYLECCNSISLIEEDFLNYVNDIKGLEMGEISLGSNTLFLSNVIPHILSEYSSLHPAIHIRLQDHDTPTLVDMLVAGELDIVIDNLPSPDSRLTPHYLGRELLLIAVPSEFSINIRLSDYSYSYEDILEGKHLSFGRSCISRLHMFRDQPFILLDKGFDTRNRCDKVFEDCGLSIRPLYEFNQLQTSFGTAASGLGITVASDTLIRNSSNWGSRMTYYTLDHREFARDVYCYTRKNRMLTRAMEEFIQISRELCPLLLSSPAD